MLRIIVDNITRFFTWINKNHKVKVKQNSSIKVNLGCGLAVAPGWINIDGSLNTLIAKWPKFFHKIIFHLSGASHYYTFEKYTKILKDNIFIHHNLAYNIPFLDNTVDYLYSSHFIEHLFKEDAKRLIKDAFRVLKSKGMIRICIPDLEYAMNLYSKGEKEKMLDSYFFVDRKLGFFARHKYMYDFELLKKNLGEAGFSNIKKCSYHKGDVPDIEILDIDPKATLYVEAIKK